MAKKPLMLMILDGWGTNPNSSEKNAITAANPENFNRLYEKYPHTAIKASGEAVGLPDGQMGNSEVGHLNLGAGRVVYQPLVEISKEIRDGEFFEKNKVVEAFKLAKESEKSIHFIGLLSDGGVHSHINHLFGLLEMAKRTGLSKVYIHAFMDGRDTAPSSGLGFMKQLEAKIAELGVGTIASISGRYYAAQNMYPKDSGAYTGEVSPVMLKELGVKYVILGHSERREYFHESNLFINEKVKSALSHDITPILCVGEKLEERESGKTMEVNEKQVREGMAGLTAEQAVKVVVAYEPVWAIGTGKTATPEMAEETHKEIRDVLVSMFGAEAAAEITIQYGGSMNAKNAEELLAMENIDGGLVGGASLEADMFIQVIKAGAR